MYVFFNFGHAMKKLLPLLFCLIPFWGCSTDSVQNPSLSEGAFGDSFEGLLRSEHADELLGLPEDFVEVKASGSVSALGTNDSMASSKERPAMNVAFGQNFFMGEHEVTCGEFNAVMKYVSGLQLPCADENLPAVNVTFFDAVLYANAKSRLAKRDTAYTYKQAVFDAQKNCINLEGYAFHPEKESFRLPTEAEWVFVAAQNWNPAGEWVSENSGGVLHPVCSHVVMGGFCDMVGNAKEWVNDWMSPFKDSLITNYVGAPDGGSLGERVLKGGAYFNSASSVNLYSRGDVYTVASVTKAGYVGFRLAFGAIPSASWMNWNGSVESSPVISLASSSTIHSKLGSLRAKLAFRNDNTGNLAYIDYSQSSAVVEIQDTIDVYHPEISPDGGRVAFCSGLEGVRGPSALYVRNLDEKGTGLVKLDVESAAIPRWRVFGTDTVILYVTDAGSNKDDVDFLGKSTWMVPFSAGAFGIPVKLLDGAYHDGMSEDLMLAVTGSSLLRVKKGVPGVNLFESNISETWYGGEQACNVSLAKDGTNRVAFLDFGGSQGQAFVGRSYNAHEYILVADASGKLTKMVQAPAGYTFDHTEWVSGFVKRKNTFNNKFIVATLANVNGAHSKITLVNVEDGSVEEIVEGDELWHPSFWVRSSLSDNENVQIDYDSAGVYFVEGGADNAKRLRFRMEYFWKYKDSAEIIGIGSSRMSNGFDPPYLTSAAYPLNMGFFQSGFLDIYEFYRNYIRHNAKNLKYIVFSVDLDIWFYSDSDNFFYTEYKNYPGFVYDENHDYWRNSDYSLIGEATNEGIDIPSYRKIFGTNRSSLYDDIKGWGGENPVCQDSGWMDVLLPWYQKAYGMFVDLLKMTAEDGVIAIGVIFPQAPVYRNTGAFGRHGLRRSEAAQTIAAIDSLQRVYPHFILMDENKMGYHDYTDDMAQDADHLAPLGARLFTERLDSLIQTLIPLR